MNYAKVSMSKLDNKTWQVYLLQCVNDALYCGVTNDMDKRLRQHNGEIVGGAKYTRANTPCKLVYQEQVKDRSTALKRECKIKAMTRNDKWLLISNDLIITK
ncbi:GIY-YIG nuclease family protein [Bathymodiolus heckerae thiotrophic gill symbiont]|uniref:GIY-YIG nuclease family protein n=1 Tax=Bathymodiolus heckerae thiotrophic gill symbiont TaxID=1052212 RepID=UPI001FCED7E4|nr:GIY-YIG nuclease family protein [Bathymodiolus heckerae thiotrophic gill symbiont]